MQNDDVIWHVLNNQHCSFKAKLSNSKIETFCKNEYNFNGLCTKSSCPLANSQYATVREEQGVCYLYMKTVERAHTPAKLWEKVKLDKNFAKALAQIDEQLIYWPGYMKHKCKQRLTKITQYLIRMRKLRKKERPRLVGVKPKEERVQRKREQKALIAAKVEHAIEKELLDRLIQGDREMEDGIFNAQPGAFQKAVEQLQESESEDEDEEEYEDEDEQEGGEEEKDVDEFVEDDSDIEDLIDGYEYEMDEDDEEREMEEVVQQKAVKAGPAAKKGGRGHLDIRFDD
ncbi:maintenance of killer 16 (mak16) protein, putative [Acanthamoeba castellanii str. Neff]|uniref:Protein MAK16 homolog n=1 Tax=Acanthamoeba castellanii (strain ATCC 30010 / Neff) TaxID=1257118 RepID=L8GR74_ACACF|nr:maintenance of killer 16 (mak16) protein, putative [Acanthamoeba castellanii str. Neff]ELR15143.1 maintenance of killer 16 (mak16) protein, putative [Acanthamoeba castellanii str. Neff]